MKFRATTLGEISGGGSYGLGASASMDSSGPKFLRTTDIVSGTIDWSKVPYCSADSVAIEKYKLFSEDIVISRTGANAGLNCIVLEPPENAIFAGYLVRFKINRELADAKYVSYLLRSKAWEEYVEVTRTGSAQPQFNAVLMGQFPISLPSLKTQKAVSSFLRALDAKIAANNAISKTLEDIAQTIFKSWFIDFDPVKAKMAGEKPAGMDAATAALFPDSMEESEIGLIPRGWELKKVEEVVKRITVKGLPKSTILQNIGRTLVLEQGDSVIAGFIDDNADIEATCDSPAFVFGDHTCRMRISTMPFSIFPNMIVLTSENPNTYWAFGATLGLQKFETYRRHWMELAYKVLVVPNTEAADVYEEQVKPLFEMIDSLLVQNRILSELRDDLLPRLISGELQIPVEMLAS